MMPRGPAGPPRPPCGRPGRPARFEIPEASYGVADGGSPLSPSTPNASGRPARMCVCSGSREHQIAAPV